MGLGESDQPVIYRMLDDVDAKLDQLIKGEKLYLNPEIEHDALWINLLKGFWPEDAEMAKNPLLAYDRNLDSPPQTYYVTPQQVIDGQERLVRQVNTKVHPLHENLFKDSQRLLKGMGLHGVHNVAIAGADLQFRDQRDFEKLYAHADNLVLSEKGDLVALSQTVKALKAAINSEGAFADNKKSVTIDNSSGRYSSFLKLAGLDYDEGVDWLDQWFSAKGKDISLKVVSQPKAVTSYVQALGYNLGKQPEPQPKMFDAVFFLTGSEEKEADARRLMRKDRWDFQQHHANAICGHCEHAPEFMYSYGGNDLDKMQAALADKIAHPDLDNDLAKFSVKRDTAYLMVADGGESVFETRLRDTMALQRYKNLSHPLTEFPGSETKPVSQSMGATKKDTYRKYAQAYGELGASADLRFVDNCVVMIAPLVQDDPANPRLYAVKSKSVGSYAFEPRPDYHTQPTQRHFQVPHGQEKTIAELEEDGDPWMVEGLAISRAMRLMAVATGSEQKPLSLTQAFEEARKIKVSMPFGVDGNPALNTALKKEGFQIADAQPIRNQNDVRRVLRSGLPRIYDAQAPLQAGENYWYKYHVLPALDLVATQLRDPVSNGVPHVMFGKPLIEKQADHAKAAGTVSQDLHLLYKSTNNPASAMRYIVDRVSSVPIEKAARETHVYTPLPSTGRESITFLLSASSANETVNDDAYETAINAGLNGFDIKSGLGWACPMGWNVYAALELKREGFDVNIQGVQDPYAMKTENWPLQQIEAFMGKGHAVIAPDLLVRGNQLFDVEEMKDPKHRKIVVSLANGIGGYEEEAQFLALREEGKLDPKRSFLLLQNRPIETTDGPVYPKQKLIDLLKQRGEMDNVFVFETPEQMVQILQQITGREMTYYPVERPQNTIYPFEDIKNPYYKWLMDRHDHEGHQPPKTRIRDVVDSVHDAHDLQEPPTPGL